MAAQGSIGTRTNDLRPLTCVQFTWKVPVAEQDQEAEKSQEQPLLPWLAGILETWSPKNAFKRHLPEMFTLKIEPFWARGSHFYIFFLRHDVQAAGAGSRRAP